MRDVSPSSLRVTHGSAAGIRPMTQKVLECGAPIRRPGVKGQHSLVTILHFFFHRVSGHMPRLWAEARTCFVFTFKSLFLFVLLRMAFRISPCLPVAAKDAQPGSRSCRRRVNTHQSPIGIKPLGGSATRNLARPWRKCAPENRWQPARVHVSWRAG